MQRVLLIAFSVISLSTVTHGSPATHDVLLRGQVVRANSFAPVAGVPVIVGIRTERSVGAFDALPYRELARTTSARDGSFFICLPRTRKAMSLVALGMRRDGRDRSGVHREISSLPVASDTKRNLILVSSWFLPAEGRFRH
jgi:hypothetical protein